MDFQTLELISWKRNQFLITPENYCGAKAQMISPTFNLPVEELRQRWMDMIASQPRIETGKADDGIMQYNFTQRTKLLRFPDIITVRFIPLKQHCCTLAVYSRSRYGRRDFGVNKDRVCTWLDALAPDRD
jgi:uncharacterized protein (DUF1499 family)